MNTIELFGMTTEQTRILFSVEKALVESDIRQSEHNISLKRTWLQSWIEEVLQGIQGNNEMNLQIPSVTLYEYPALIDAIKREYSRQPESLTWFYLVVLEATLFIPYTPFDDKTRSKEYHKLHYHNQRNTLKEIVRATGLINAEYVDIFYHSYKKRIDKLTGKVQKMVSNVLAALLISAITAATAGLFAGPVAVTLFGAQFANLSGAALTSACLAFAGGGAIAAGGAGMAGGVAAIVGGGALLGLGFGSATVAGANAFLFGLAKSPALSLTQAAKLEVVMREIILNTQQDIKTAQAIIANYKKQILELRHELDNLRLDIKRNDSEIKQLKKTLEYFEKSYRSMCRFESSYEVGLNQR